MPKLCEWCTVEWDDERIYQKVSPPGRDEWQDNFKWGDIIRVCFEANDFTMSDDLILFTSQRPESYRILIEAKGGLRGFWNGRGFPRKPSILLSGR